MNCTIFYRKYCTPYNEHISEKYDFCIRQRHHPMGFECRCYCSKDYCNKNPPKCDKGGYHAKGLRVTFIPTYGTAAKSEEFYNYLKYVIKYDGYEVDEFDKPIYPPVEPGPQGIPGPPGPPGPAGSAGQPATPVLVSSANGINHLSLLGFLFCYIFVMFVFSFYQ